MKHGDLQWLAIAAICAIGLALGGCAGKVTGEAKFHYKVAVGAGEGWSSPEVKVKAKVKVRWLHIPPKPVLAPSPPPPGMSCNVCHK